MSNRSLFGILLVLAGAAVILNSYFQIFEGASSWWPLIVILIGLIQVIKHTSSPLSGILFITVGLLFLGRNFEWFPGEMLFPIIIILAGCWFIFGRFLGKTKQESIDRVNYFTLFSGLETNNDSQDFKGGSVTAVFGGSEIDLRNARISENGALLELTAVFGGIELTVPVNWQVHITGTPLFGGWENKTVSTLREGAHNLPILRINCTAMFGGVTVKN